MCWLFFLGMQRTRAGKRRRVGVILEALSDAVQQSVGAFLRASDLAQLACVSKWGAAWARRGLTRVSALTLEGDRAVRTAARAGCGCLELLQVHKATGRALVALLGCGRNALTLHTFAYTAADPVAQTVLRALPPGLRTLTLGRLRLSMLPVLAEAPCLGSLTALDVRLPWQQLDVSQAAALCCLVQRAVRLEALALDMDLDSSPNMVAIWAWTAAPSLTRLTLYGPVNYNPLLFHRLVLAPVLRQLVELRLAFDNVWLASGWSPLVLLLTSAPRLACLELRLQKISWMTNSRTVLDFRPDATATLSTAEWPQAMQDLAADGFWSTPYAAHHLRHLLKGSVPLPF